MNNVINDRANENLKSIWRRVFKAFDLELPVKNCLSTKDDLMSYFSFHGVTRVEVVESFNSLEVKLPPKMKVRLSHDILCRLPAQISVKITDLKNPVNLKKGHIKFINEL